MRQWMVHPKILCRKHLLGEHVEHHMFVGTLSRGFKVGGYLDNNLLEPKSLLTRHNELASEMVRRGFNHNTPLKVPDGCIDYLKENVNRKIDRDKSLDDLLGRCKDCRQRYNFLVEKGVIDGDVHSKANDGQSS